MSDANVSASKGARGAWTHENGEALKRAREAQGLSAKKLGAYPEIQADQRTVYAWERGEYGPGRQRAMALARVLKMDAREWGSILGGVEPEGRAWELFKATPEYAAASEEARRFVRTLWLPDNAAPTVEWYKSQLAQYALLPRA